MSCSLFATLRARECSKYFGRSVMRRSGQTKMSPHELAKVRQTAVYVPPSVRPDQCARASRFSVQCAAELSDAAAICKTSRGRHMQDVHQACREFKVKYPRLIDGEGVEFKSKELWKFMCCDCGLVHNVILVAGRKGTPIGLAMARNKRATAAARRHK
jgi:hypothetical protein